MDWVPYRLAFVFSFVAALAISGYFRARARRETGTIPRSAEGAWAVAGRLLMAAPLFGSIVLYAVRPRWMGWASLDIPEPLRWLGVGLGLSVMPLLVWVLRSIGSNISETVLVKGEHELVTHGPYRWVRHPLYSSGLLLILASGLIAGSWFLLVLWAIAVAIFRAVVIPSEEANLETVYGQRYRDYREDTGALLPQLRRRFARRGDS